MKFKLGMCMLRLLQLLSMTNIPTKLPIMTEDAIFTEWSGFFSCASSTVPEQGISDQKANGSIYV